MLPWADPQALHEMMRQGVSRCVADIAAAVAPEPPEALDSGLVAM